VFSVHSVVEFEYNRVGRSIRVPAVGREEPMTDEPRKSPLAHAALAGLFLYLGVALAIFVDEVLLRTGWLPPGCPTPPSMF
jgi:hypothetical protein